MPTITLSLKVTGHKGLAQRFRDKVIEAKLKAARRWRDQYLIPNSPRGGSNAGEALRNNWLVRNIDTTVIIENIAQNAYFRVVGRGPSRGGNPGNFRQNLARWVRAKGLATDGQSVESIAIAIARYIARFGTQRWRDNDNLLGIDSRTGRLKRNSPAYRLADAMCIDVNAIEVK